MADNGNNDGLEVSELDRLEGEISGELALIGRQVMGGAASWVLHMIKVVYVLYSGFHSIAATSAYAGAGQLSQAFQIVGIVSVEATLLALYVAFMSSRIVGFSMKMAAGITYAIGFAATAITIIGDSQAHAGAAVPYWLQIYLVWVLPALPAVMAIGVFATHQLEPARVRARREAEQLESEQALAFTARQAQRRARLTEAKQLENLRMGGRRQIIGYLDEFFKSPLVRQAAHKAAAGRLPDMLREIGITGLIDVDGDGVRDDMRALLEAIAGGNEQGLAQLIQRLEAGGLVDSTGNDAGNDTGTAEGN